MSRRSLSRLCLSRRTVAWLCALLLVISILPMYALALYNHAFYDDFGFSLLTRNAWQQTGSDFAVLEAAVRNTILQLRGIDTYQEFVLRHRRAMESGESF